jgi:hypothetical protein
MNRFLICWLWDLRKSLKLMPSAPAIESLTQRDAIAGAHGIVLIGRIERRHCLAAFARTPISERQTEISTSSITKCGFWESGVRVGKF